MHSRIWERLKQKKIFNERQKEEKFIKTMMYEMNTKRWEGKYMDFLDFSLSFICQEIILEWGTTQNQISFVAISPKYLVPSLFLFKDAWGAKQSTQHYPF